MSNTDFHGEQCREQEFGVIAGIKNGKYTLYLVSKHVSIVLHPFLIYAFLIKFVEKIGD